MQEHEFLSTFLTVPGQYLSRFHVKVTFQELWNGLLLIASLFVWFFVSDVINSKLQLFTLNCTLHLLCVFAFSFMLTCSCNNGWIAVYTLLKLIVVFLLWVEEVQRTKSFLIKIIKVLTLKYCLDLKQTYLAATAFLSLKILFLLVFRLKQMNNFHAFKN